MKTGRVVLVKCYIDTDHFEQELSLRDKPGVRHGLARAELVYSKNDSEAASSCDIDLSPFIVFSASEVWPMNNRKLVKEQQLPGSSFESGCCDDPVPPVGRRTVHAMGVLSAVLQKATHVGLFLTPHCDEIGVLACDNFLALMGAHDEQTMGQWLHCQAPRNSATKWKKSQRHCPTLPAVSGT
jgi:hypothetical protein